MKHPFRKITITNYPYHYVSKKIRNSKSEDDTVEEIQININKILYIRKYSEAPNISQIIMAKEDYYFYALHTQEELMEIFYGTKT